MATIIDSLIVTLGLDPSNFTKGQKETAAAQIKMKDQAERSSKDVQEANKRMAESFGKIKEQVLSLTAVLLGGHEVKEFAGHIIESDAALGRLAGNLGIATEELSAWEGVAEKFGSSSADMDAAFRNVSRMMSEFKAKGTFTGMTELIRAGVDMGKFLSPAATNLDRMRMIQGALSNQTADMAQLWGTTAGFTEKTVTMLRETNENMDEILATQRAQNVVTKEQTQSAKELEEGWATAKGQAQGLFRTVLNDLAPALTVALHWLEEFLTYGKEHMPALEFAVGGLATLFTGLAAISFGGLISGLGGVGLALSGILGTIGGIMAAVGVGAAAGAGLGLLFNKVFEKLTGGVPLGTWLYNQFHGDEGAGMVGGRHGAGHDAPGGGDKLAHLSALEQKYGLPSGLLSSVYGQESSYGKHLLSPKGAKGPFQFMDATSKEYGLTDPYDFDQSADAAARKFKDLLAQSHGDVPGALAAYNSGKFNPNGNAETRNYVASIMGHMRSVGSGGGFGGGAGGGTTTTIGSMTIVTQATDAKGIARDIHGALNEFAYAGQGQTGLH